jgi:hypothetical protein
MRYQLHQIFVAGQNPRYAASGAFMSGQGCDYVVRFDIVYG